MLAYLENKEKSLLAKARDKKGFTLVELMIVIVIIGVLVAMAMANFGKSGEDAKVARAKSDARTLAGAVQIYYSDTGDLTKIKGKQLDAGGGSEQDLCVALMDTGTSPATGEKVGPWMSSCPIPPWTDSHYIVQQDANGQLYVEVKKGSEILFNSKNLAGKKASASSGS